MAFDLVIKRLCMKLYTCMLITFGKRAMDSTPKEWEFMLQLTEKELNDLLYSKIMFVLVVVLQGSKFIGSDVVEECSHA